MLKIISTNSSNNEEFLKKEMSISTSLYDFLLGTEDGEKIISTVTLLFHEEKKSEKLIYDKLLFILSLVISSKNVRWDEKMKKILENVISASKNFKNLEIFKILSDLYFIIPESQCTMKEFMIMKIVEIANSNNYEQIIEIFNNLFNISQNIQKILEIYSDFVSKNHIYHLIKAKQDFLIKALNNLKELSTNQKRLLFFLVFSPNQVAKVKLNLISEKIKNGQELQTENNLLESLIAKDYKKALKFSFDSLNEVYGTESVEKIQNWSKQYIIQQVFLSLGNIHEISFEDISSKLGVEFDDIEEILIEGDISGLFKVKIHYEQKIIKILFVKKSSYSKEEIGKLNKDIISIKGKLDFVLKAIEAI